MRRVLVTGSSGFIGKHLVPALTEQHWEVSELPRAPVGQALLSMPDSSQLARSHSVVHLAGVAHRQTDPEELKRVNEDWPVALYTAAASAGVSDFVWMSSIKVLGDESVEPLGVEHPYRPCDGYAESKMRAELRLLELAPQFQTRLKIVRSPLVYGPGVKANFRLLLQAARWNRNGLPLPLGRARALRSMVGIRNLCSILVRLTEEGEGVVHVSDGRDTSVLELIELLGARKRLLLPVPEPVVRGLCRFTGNTGVYERLFKPLRVDISHTMDMLNWSPPYRLEEELLRTWEWFRREG